MQKVQSADSQAEKGAEGEKCREKGAIEQSLFLDPSYNMAWKGVMDVTNNLPQRTLVSTMCHA